ncbi:MAG: type IV pili methyl-accepting chemotaxis transducer N-terminal domain-containing protein [Zoogloeaceae bacterium]|nr:type IV pili methyl-accepting chemotaxis transducer N-terminal domain-containing protein [Zoogloeaceae bacterium]
MPVPTNSLHFKITGILLVFFVAAFAAIGLTLFTSWHLKGAAAAINDAGSLRMGAYRVAYLVEQGESGALDSTSLSARLLAEMARYDLVLEGLLIGDPLRPLYVPRDDDITADLKALEQLWRGDIRPALARLAMAPETAPDARSLALDAEGLVARIDGIVRRMEHSYASEAAWLRGSQVLLVFLAIVGTVFLIRFFSVQVIQPVDELSRGLRKMENEDFGVRLPIQRHDELGEVTEGFNRMAAHLQHLYRTLEQRVQDKTESLTARNRELGILYSTISFLHEPQDIDSPCRGFLLRIRETMGASGAAIRLMDSGSENLYITYCEGLDEGFLDEETMISCADCLCGEASQRPVTIFARVDMPGPGVTRDTCNKAGFRAVTATTISANKRAIGVFNLFFDESHTLGEPDRKMLETLGEQLGVAIDNLRLQSRERELAVSEERNLLARELHDSIAQALAYMNLQLQMCEQALAADDTDEVRQSLVRIRQGVQESYDDVRELLVHFRSRVGQQDLETAIGAALRRLGEHGGVATHLDIDGGGAPLDSETETQVLYIVQEALSNVRKHARARSVQVWLHRGLDGLIVSVRDDGIGFDDTRAATQDDSHAHIGLNVMRERAQRIGAGFTVHSKPGKGTEVRIELQRRHEETTV